MYLQNSINTSLLLQLCTFRKQVLMNILFFSGFVAGFVAGSCINEVFSKLKLGNRKSLSLINFLLVYMHLHSLFRLTDGYVYWQDAVCWGAHVLDLNPKRLAHIPPHIHALPPDCFQLVLSCSKIWTWRASQLFSQYEFLKITGMSSTS